MDKKFLNLKNEVLEEVKESFRRVEEISEINTLKILDAMRELKISDAQNFYGLRLRGHRARKT